MRIKSDVVRLRTYCFFCKNPLSKFVRKGYEELLSYACKGCVRKKLKGLNVNW